MANPTDDTRLAWGRQLRDALAAITELDEVIGRRIERQAKLDEALASAREAASKEQADIGEAAAALNAAADDAGRVLRLVAVKLEAAWLEQTIPEAAYRKVTATAFPNAQVPTRPGERHAALLRVATVLGDNADADPGGALGTLAKTTADKLVAANETAKRESDEAHAAQQKLDEARNAWDEGYLATKEIVSGLLREAGRRSEMTTLFADLVPSAGAAAPKR